MKDGERAAFAEVISAVYTFYRVDLSDAAIAIWWSTMKVFDLQAIRDALGRHAVNPDTGQFLPKPADVVKMLGGSTLDSAMLALHKVEEAMSSAGAYHSVAFDDPIIHTVVNEMGGWVALCSSKDWTFRRTEFLNRYRTYRARSIIPPFPSKLVGIADAENELKGFGHKPGDTILIGAIDDARRVLNSGTVGNARISMTPMSATVKDVARALEEKP